MKPEATQSTQSLKHRILRYIVLPILAMVIAVILIFSQRLYISLSHSHQQALLLEVEKVALAIDREALKNPVRVETAASNGNRVSSQTIAKIDRLLHSFQPYQTADWILVDTQAQTIASTLDLPASQEKLKQRQYQGILNRVHRQPPKPAFQPVTTEPDRQRYFLAATAVGTGAWTLLMQVTAEEILGPFQQMLVGGILGGLVAIAILSIILIRMANRIDQTEQERSAELKTAKEEAEAAKEAAETASRTKSQFLANMSHELRTPLNAILGYSDMLMEEASEINREDFCLDLQKINESGKHLLGMIADILDLSKIETGRMDLYLEPIDIAALIQDTVTTSQPIVEKNANTLAVCCPDDIGIMYADITKIRQNLLNLLSNASKFTEKGQLTLSVSRYQNNGEDWIRFQMNDNGIGMSLEQQKHVFKPFTQVDSSSTRKYGGTGLGLAIAKKFCDMMGGDIAVESAPGQGSTFTIQLPAQVAKPEAKLSIPLPDNETHAAAKGNNTILVIDDDPIVHEIVQRCLGKEGFSVKSATSGQEGIQMARKLTPDAITLDVMMPGMDGWSVLQALKADPDLADIPVVMMSMAGDRSLGYALGADDYLVKPIDRKRMMSVLRKYQSDPAAGAVMVVDDDTFMREMVRRQLEKAGWQVIEAENGRKALERMQPDPPQLILLDLMMPEMDGFAFVQELRNHPDWQSIPVIITTAKELTAADRQQLQGKVESVVEKGSGGELALLGQVQSLVSAAISDRGNLPTINS